MLIFGSSKPVFPDHLVIMGAGGFVGRATRNRLKRDGLEPVALTRREVDLLSSHASQALAAHLTPNTTLIVTSALAPVKNVAMLLDNLRMMQAVVEAAKS